MLRIVHPPREGQATDTPARRKGARSPSLSLTAEESRHLRVSIRNVARAYGGTDVLATVIGVPVGTLYNASAETRRPCGTLAIRLARAAGMTVEAILGGKLTAAGRCDACGSRVGGAR